jgi:hypothetical protein
MGGASVVCCFQLTDPAIGRSYAVSKWAYCILFTIVTVVTWVLRDYSDQVRLRWRARRRPGKG